MFWFVKAITLVASRLVVIKLEDAVVDFVVAK